MPRAMDREGAFRIQILEYYLQEFDGGSVCVALRAQVMEYWDGSQWTDWLPYDFEVEGNVFIVKKNGDIMEKNVQSLCSNAGWDGDIRSVSEGTWRPTPCQCTVKADEYKRQTRYRIDFLNGWDRTPGAGGGVSPEKAHEIANKYGARLRAITGNIVRNSPPPTGSAPAAPARPSPPPPSVDGGEHVPF